MELAGAWFRVSSGGQDEASQFPDVMAWCESHGYEVAKTYALHGASASKGQHQKMLEKMLDDMRLGLIRVLVVWASNRIERRGAFNAFWLAQKVKEAGGRIEYVKDAYLNAANDMSDVMLAMAATKDKLYSKSLSDASNRTVGLIRGNGSFFGRAPWGYEPVGDKYFKQLVPTDEGRKYIPEIFSRVIDGQSLNDVGLWLKEQTGKTFWARTVGHMVRNPVYIGHATDESGKVVHECEALVDASVFQKAGKALDGRPKRGPVKEENRAFLAGHLDCADCADKGIVSPMYKINAGNKRKDGTKVQCWYYRCSGKGPQRKGCGNMVKMADADKMADGNMVVWNREIEEVRLIPGHNWDAEIEEVKFRLSRLDQEAEDYDDRHSELRTELRALRGRESVPDTIQRTGTGITYAQAYSKLDRAGKMAFIREHGVRFTARNSDVKGLPEVSIRIPDFYA